MNKIIIAIDGHSSCGKSTMAKWLAKEIGYVYVDTGAMYRAVTFFALSNGLIKEKVINTSELQRLLPLQNIRFAILPDGTQHITLNGVDIEKEIRGMEVSKHVSPIAALPFVRESMGKLQRNMGKDKGIVMDGRDIGTCIFPQAELKIFVTASAEVRAKRRYDELVDKGEVVDFENILKNVEERDYIDSHREIAPLRKANDALLLDNSSLSIPEQNEWLIKAYNNTIQNIY